jgi:hypothetical protein
MAGRSSDRLLPDMHIIERLGEILKGAPMGDAVRRAEL